MGGALIFLYASGMSVAAIVFGTEIGVFQRILHTVSLSLNEWLVCAAVAAIVVGVSEIRKFVLRRRLAAEASIAPRVTGNGAASSAPA